VTYRFLSPAQAELAEALAHKHVPIDAILEADTGALVNTVNTVGVMG